MFIIIHKTIDIIAEMKQSGILIFWWRNHPSTSYVAATFHQTIGQCAHQSLSNTATTELDMIPQGLRVNAGLHIAKGHKSAIQHSWVYQAINQSAKPTQFKDQSTAYMQQTMPLMALWWRHRQPDDIPNQQVKHSSSHKTTQSCSWP